MDVLTNLRTFLAVARTGSFSEAARQLHVVPSVVAKRVAQLEQTMHARLFQRTTRMVELTDAGHRLKTRAATLVADLDTVVADVRGDEGKLEGHIRVIAPTTITVLRLAPVFQGFMARHDRITLEIALADRSINPVEEGADIVINGRGASFPGVIDVPLCPVQPQLCASPAYLDRRGTPIHPRDLAEHECLRFGPNGDQWVFHSSRGLIHLRISGRFVADDNSTLAHFATAGMGIGFLPDYVCHEPLADGRLVPVLPNFPLQDPWFKAYVPRGRHTQAHVQALLQWLSAKIPAALGHNAASARLDTPHEHPAAERPEPQFAGNA